MYHWLAVYKKEGYLAVVNKCAKASMQKAVAEVKALPDYKKNGEVCVHSLGMLSVCLIFCFLVQWVITDARHDSTSNAYHTTVPCLSGRCVLLCDIPCLYWLTSQHQTNPRLLYCVEGRALCCSDKGNGVHTNSSARGPWPRYAV